MVNLLADMGIQPGTLQSGLIAATASTDPTAPTSTINALASFSAGSVVTISGTASDVGGGVIAGVEVSTDNGASWYPAIGDENWTYTWSPQVAGTYTIQCRAVDDSINLETPSAGRTVTVTAPTYITLFSGSATPAIVNTTDASAVELGVKFQTSVAGTVSGIRFYKGSQDTGTHTGRTLVEHRHQAGNRYLYQRNRERLAERDLLQPGHVDAGRDLRRLLSHECRPLLQQR